MYLKVYVGWAAMCVIYVEQLLFLENHLNDLLKYGNDSVFAFSAFHLQFETTKEGK